MDASSISRYLDERFEKFEMPCFSNMNVDYLSSRLSVHVSSDSWILLFNSIVWWPAADGLQGMIEVVGPGVRGVQGFDNDRSTCPGVVETDDSGDEIVAVSVRGRPVELSSLAIEPDFDLQADMGFWTAVALLDDYRESLLASKEEWAPFVPAQFKQVLQLDAWQQPDFDTLPSQTETFSRISSAIASGDFRDCEICAAPNTDWARWLPK